MGTVQEFIAVQISPFLGTFLCTVQQGELREARIGIQKDSRHSTIKFTALLTQQGLVTPHTVLLLCL